MKLAHLTWQEVSALSRDIVVLIPTGSLEQHGPHLPLFTDTLLATHVAEGIEAKIPDKILLTPTLWLGCSGHHLKFPGTLSANFEAYEGAVESVIQSLVPHGFRKFYVLNGHGGNNDPNGVALRRIKSEQPSLIVGHSGYFAALDQPFLDGVMTGKSRTIRHACEAEASMMLAAHPDLVRLDKLRDDGFATDPPVRGLIWHFDEQTEEGSHGQATLATAEKGATMLSHVIDAWVKQLGDLYQGVALVEC